MDVDVVVGKEDDSGVSVGVETMGSCLINGVMRGT